MRAMNRRNACTGLALCALVCTAPADAATPQKLRKATFAVTVDGVQRSTWTEDHQAAGIGGCDGSYHAQGTEKVRFTSGKFTVRAMGLPALSAPVLSRGTGARTRAPEFKLRGSITRDSSTTAGSDPDSGCGGADGPPVAKDCGVKKFAGLGAKLDYRLSSKPRDMLELGTFNATDPFRNCGGGGTQFPVIATRNMNRPMNLRLPRRELFNRKLGKIILIGNAREGDQSGEHKFTTTTRWVITLVRK